MTLTAPLALFLIAFVVFAIETWRSKSLIALGLALVALAFAVTNGLKV